MPKRKHLKLSKKNQKKLKQSSSSTTSENIPSTSASSSNIQDFHGNSERVICVSVCEFLEVVGNAHQYVEAEVEKNKKEVNRYAVERALAIATDYDLDKINEYIEEGRKVMEALNINKQHQNKDESCDSN